MKKVILILFGIVLGIAMSAAFVRYRVMPLYFEMAKVTDEKLFTTLVGDLSVTQCGDGTYLIKARENPKITIGIGHYPEQKIMTTIDLMDVNLNGITCVDMDSDGEWDGWIYAQNQTNHFSYSRKSGYPDVIWDDSGMVARIDDEYYPLRIVEGKHFIEKDGVLVEVESTPLRYFKIKKHPTTLNPF